MKTIAYLLLAATLLAACAPSESVLQTALAATDSARQTAGASLAQTQTAGAPTDTPPPSETPTASATVVPTETPTASATPVPTDTATASATPAPSVTPAPSATPMPSATPVPVVVASPLPSATSGPAFVTVAIQVRNAVQSVGGQIDNALRVGFIDCQELVNSYEFVAARRNLSVGPELAGANALYVEGVDIFTDTNRDMYGNCKEFLANPAPGGIPQQQWGLARLGVNNAADKLHQAISAAGGTP